MRFGPSTIAVLLCASILSVSIFDRGPVVAQSKKSTSVRQQQQLVKRINQKAQRFYRKFITGSVSTEPELVSELDVHLENLLLAIDGLSHSHYVRHNLILVMQIASATEHLLLLADISSELVMAWAHLHADLDLLAKINNIRWSEAVITNELIAALAADSLKACEAGESIKPGAR